MSGFAANHSFVLSGSVASRLAHTTVGICSPSGAGNSLFSKALELLLMVAAHTCAPQQPRLLAPRASSVSINNLRGCVAWKDLFFA